MPLERDKAKELLKIIRKRGTSAFDKFVDVLLESETQSFLGKLLKSGSWKSEMNDDDYGMYIQLYSLVVDTLLISNKCVIKYISIVLVYSMIQGILHDIVHKMC